MIVELVAKEGGQVLKALNVPPYIVLFTKQSDKRNINHKRNGIPFSSERKLFDQISVSYYNKTNNHFASFSSVFFII